MTEPEKFLDRWSRMKREAAEPAAPAPPSADAEKKPEETAHPQVAEPDKPFDLDSLPSLDSITAETDMRAFLQSGVPDDLKNAALRRAWTADPGVRDFVELLENGWDFNDPNGVAGFGPIEPAEVARLVAQFMLTAPEEKKVAQHTDNQGELDRSATDALPAQPPAAVVTIEASPDAASRNESRESGQTDLPTETKSA
jgi:hypothetical protein